MKCYKIVGHSQGRNDIFQHQCTRKARYICNGIYYCALHLRKTRGFGEDPIEIETGKRVNRDKLYHQGIIELSEEINEQRNPRQDK